MAAAKKNSSAPMLATISSAEVRPTVNSIRNLASTMETARQRRQLAGFPACRVPSRRRPVSMAGYMADITHSHQQDVGQEAADQRAHLFALVGGGSGLAR